MMDGSMEETPAEGRLRLVLRRRWRVARRAGLTLTLRGRWEVRRGKRRRGENNV